MIEIKGSRILVCGGKGFFGKHLTNSLIALGGIVSSVGRKDANLTSIEDCHYLLSHNYDYVFNLSGLVGGINFNIEKPASIFFNNTVMGLNLIEVCATHYNKIKKIVSVVASCGYPDNNWNNQNMMEDQYLNGQINSTVASHGYAKRNIVLASKFYHDEYGLNAITVCPTSLYGPGDLFDISRGKVMGGLIRRFLEAKKNGDKSITCWGTGIAQREFMYVKDAAHYTILSLLKYNDSNLPLNIGSGQEICIKDLARMIAEKVEYNGTILWDETQPDGQLRKRLNRIKQNYILGEIPLTPLDVGVQQTIDWCIKEKIV